MVEPVSIITGWHFAVGVVATLAAVLVFVAAPAAKSTRLLALVLMLDGVAYSGLLGGYALSNLSNPASEYAAIKVLLAAGFALTPLYIWFVVVVMDNWVTKPLRNFIGQAMLAVLAITLPAVFLWGANSPAELRVWNLGIILPSSIVAGSFGFVAALAQYRKHRPGAAGRRDRIYLLAFGVRDGGLILFYPGYYFIDGSRSWPNATLQSFVSASLIVFVIILIYGILQGRILDVDRRFRLGISRTTAAAIVAFLFVVITESVEAALGIDNPVIGVAAAVGLFLAFQPLQRLSQNFARRIVPGKAIVAMDHDERIELYREQVRLAHEDGVVTSGEERMLRRFQERLGLTGLQVRKIRKGLQLG